MVKAIFFDIDGTLVSFETHKIPASTQEALKALRDKGIKIFIATGRPQCLINNLGDLEFDGYITVNGSYCFTAGHQPADSPDVCLHCLLHRRGRCLHLHAVHGRLHSRHPDGPVLHGRCVHRRKKGRHESHRH